MHHSLFSWFQYFPGYTPEMNHVWTAGFICLCLVLMSLVASAVAGTPEQALVPSPNFTLRNFFEFVVESLVKFVTNLIHNHGERYVPLIGSLFIYILVNNVFGLLPGTMAATQNINTTLSCGVLVFIIYNVLGFYENGMNYAKHFLGPMLLLAPLMLPIELISNCIRPLSLSIRLYVNMLGDHTVLETFLGLVPIGVPVVFYALGLFVCFMQAFVFSLLSSVYIQMATAHEH